MLEQIIKRAGKVGVIKPFSPHNLSKKTYSYWLALYKERNTGLQTHICYFQTHKVAGKTRTDMIGQMKKSTAISFRAINQRFIKRTLRVFMASRYYYNKTLSVCAAAPRISINLHFSLITRPFSVVYVTPSADINL